MVDDEHEPIERREGLAVHHAPIDPPAVAHALQEQVAPRRAEADRSAQADDFLDGRVGRHVQEREMSPENVTHASRGVGDVGEVGLEVEFQDGEVVGGVSADGEAGGVW